MNKERILSDMIYSTIQSTAMEPAEILAVLAFVIYKVTLAQAVMSGREPSDALAAFVSTLEEHFGEYLNDPKTKLLREFATALFGPK